MIKQNKKQIILALVVMLIPIIFSLFIWNQLPDSIATHFNSMGEADNYSSKLFAVFGMNGILIACYAACVFFTAADPRKKNITSKMYALCIWVVPVVSLYANATVLCHALGKKVDMALTSKLLVALILIIIGVYLPQMKQNYTIGIKLPWTLESEANWNATHKFASRLWIAAGIALLLDAFLRVFSMQACLIIMAVIVLIPVIYSYIYYLKCR